MIVHLTDTHFHPLNKLPISAKENYHDIVKSEFGELKKRLEVLRQNHEITATITGDIFNLKTQSLYTPKMLEYYSTLLDDTFHSLGIKVFTIPGNHDLTQSTYSLVQESAYNILCKASKCLIDCSNKTLSISPTVDISGIPYYDVEGVKEKIKSLSLNPQKINVLMLHSDIFKKKTDAPWYLKEYILYEDIVEFQPDLSLAMLGHIHVETPPTKLTSRTNKKVWFSKPQAFSRMTKEYLTEKSLKESFPSINEIYFEEEGGIRINTTNFDIYQAGDFLDFDEIAKMKETSNKFEAFMSDFKSTYEQVEGGFKMLSPEELIEKADLNVEVRKILNKYLNE